MGTVELVHVGLVLDQEHRPRNLALGAFDLGMPVMADQDDLAALGDIALAFDMDLGDQGTSGVEHGQVAVGGVGLHRLGHAMGTEYGPGTGGDFGQILDEDGPHTLQALDHIAVMNDLMADIDRRAILGERAFDDLDGADYAGAETPGLGKDDSHATSLSS